MTYEKTLELCRGYVKDHVLSIELDAPRYKAFRMAKPGTRIYSVLLTFTPEGITLSGDYRVTNDRALSSDPGLDLAWFVGAGSSDYLASKFLRERWVPEDCAKLIIEKAEKWEKEADEEPDLDATELRNKAKTLREIASRCTGDGDLHDVHDLLEAVAPSMVDDGMPGYTWDYMERASLTAIQEKFAELYEAWAASTPAAPKDWLLAYESLHLEVMQSMEKYSQKLGWGITGAQEECWTMLDMAVERLVKLQRELPNLATNLKDVERPLSKEGDMNHYARGIASVLAKLKELGIEPHQTVAAQG